MIFKNIFRRSAECSAGVAPAGDLPSQLADPPGEGSIRLWNNGESPEAYDASYVDAWFDARARRLLQDEFANVEPPADTFRKLLLAIEGPATQESPRPALKPSASPALLVREAIYRAVSSPMTARIVPSGVALLLALAVVGPNLSQALRNEHTISAPQQSPAASISSREPTSPAAIPPVAPGPGGAGMPEPRISAQEAPDAEHGAEPEIDETRAARALPPLKQAYRARTSQDRNEERWPRRFGPE